MAVALFSLLATIFLGPYFLLVIEYAFPVSMLLGVLLAIVFGMLFRSQGMKTSLALGGYIFTIFFLTSASIAVFFIFPIGKALLAFVAISIAGALILTVMGWLLASKFLPEVLEQSSGESDTGQSATAE